MTSTWEEYPLMYFTKHEDGTVTVDRWLDRILVSPEFLENADPAIVQRDIDGFRIKVANGEGRYRLIGLDPNRVKTYRAVRVYP